MNEEGTVVVTEIFEAAFSQNGIGQWVFYGLFTFNNDACMRIII